MIKIFNAIFDFRTTEKFPDEEGHQHELDGCIEINQNQMIILLNKEYRIEGKKNHHNAFYGNDLYGSNARAIWIEVKDRFFVGEWIQDNHHYLFSIRLNKEIKE